MDMTARWKGLGERHSAGEPIFYKLRWGPPHFEKGRPHFSDRDRGDETLALAHRTRSWRAVWNAVLLGGHRAGSLNRSTLSLNGTGECERDGARLSETPDPTTVLNTDGGSHKTIHHRERQENDPTGQVRFSRDERGRADIIFEHL